MLWTIARVLDKTKPVLLRLSDLKQANKKGKYKPTIEEASTSSYIYAS